MTLRPCWKFILIVLIIVNVNFASAQLSDFDAIKFTRADSIASLYPNYPLENVEKLTSLLTHDLPTDVEKFRSIFRWITLNIGYNVVLVRKDEEKKLQYKREPVKLAAWNKKYSTLIDTHLLTKMLAVCSGYSELLTQMCTFANIPCKKITGYARTSRSSFVVAGKTDHAWNVVELNRKWYLCDPTWASGSTMNDQFVREFKEHYFLAEPSLFARNHFPLDTAWLLMTPKPTLKEFASAPVFLTGSFVDRIKSFSPKAGVVTIKNGEPFTFSFTNDPAIPVKRFSLEVMDNYSKKTFVHSDLVPDNNGKYTLSHYFASKGHYKVRVIVNSDYSMIFEIHVK
jgi:hypothetical protein